MANQPGVWGIDLGQCALKALRVELIDDQVTATAFDYVEHPKILSQPDADPDQLTREALDKFLSRNELRGDIVAISIPTERVGRASSSCRPWKKRRFRTSSAWLPNSRFLSI